MNENRLWVNTFKSTVDSSHLLSADNISPKILSYDKQLYEKYRLSVRPNVCRVQFSGQKVNGEVHICKILPMRDSLPPSVSVMFSDGGRSQLFIA